MGSRMEIRMKVLMINSSIKRNRSRSYKLAQAFIEGLCENLSVKSIEISNVWLYEQNIQDCKCCYCCWKPEHEGCCIIQDDMNELLNKYIEADLVIWSFPLIFFYFPASMKKFIDRTLPLYMAQQKIEEGRYIHLRRYSKMADRREVFISTCGFPVKVNNYEPVDEFIRILYHNKADKIFCTEGNIFEEKRFEKIVTHYLLAVKEAGRTYSFENGILEKSKRRLDQQMIVESLYEKEANSNILWMLNQKE